MAAANADALSVSMLVTELDKQHASINADMAAVIQNSLAPIQTSIDCNRETVDTVGGQLTALEALVSGNSDQITTAEEAIEKLKTENAALVDKIDDLENQARRVNLRIVGVPEGIKDGADPTKFVADMLEEITGEGVFDKPPEIERTHCALAPKPKQGQPPRTFIFRFHRFSDKEWVLRWAREHKLRFHWKALRMYPDLSAILSKKRAAFNTIKAALYQKGIRFRLMHPVRLRVSFGGETLTFDTPTEAHSFYDQQIKNSG
ncbi:hypothetical protein AAFF_G00026630 [Aldrovandia affinis]|uniref:LINE-1 type transposase domain-containing 1 n=1 Tax=Aldrovandia affinis TaxID=143900 RepID=A0AAD7WGP2_9TELE|nr:hypothetical protein AAFF_G00026630 [Aldrovandia affinis]